jgi:hypothetical protein
MKLGDFLFWAGQITFGVICLRGIQRSLWKHYLPFYVYIIFNLVFAFPIYFLGVYFGLASPIHSFAWSAHHYVEIALRVLVLFWIYRLILKATPGGGFKADIALSILATLPIAAYLLSGGQGSPRPLSYYFPYTVIFPTQLIACSLVYVRALRSRGFQMGRNLSGILFGLSLMTALHTVNITRFATGAWSFQLFAFLHQSTSLLAMLILAAFMWDYWPPSTAGSPPGSEDLRRFSRNVAKAVRRLREQRQ